MPEDGIVCLDNRACDRDLVRAEHRTRVANTSTRQCARHDGRRLAVRDYGRVIYPTAALMGVCGDGGFMMNSQELETAVRSETQSGRAGDQEDSCLRMVRWKQACRPIRRLRPDFANPDFVTYAQNPMADAAIELPPWRGSCRRWKGAFAAGGVHLVAVPIDLQRHPRVLVDELGGNILGGSRIGKGSASHAAPARSLAGASAPPPWWGRYATSPAPFRWMSSVWVLVLPPKRHSRYRRPGSGPARVDDSRQNLAFTVPLFDEFIRRKIPDLLRKGTSRPQPGYLRVAECGYRNGYDTGTTTPTSDWIEPVR